MLTKSPAVTHSKKSTDLIFNEIKQNEELGKKQIASKPLTEHLQMSIPHELCFGNIYREVLFYPEVEFYGIEKEYSDICKTIQTLPPYQKNLQIQHNNILQDCLERLANLRTVINADHLVKHLQWCDYFIRKIEFSCINLHIRYGVFDNRDNRTLETKLQELSHFLNELAEKFNEEWWAYACLAIRQTERSGQHTTENCKRLANAVENITSIEHQKYLSTFFQNYYEYLNEYPNYSLFLKGMQPLLMLINDKDGFGAYAQYCHRYLSHNIVVNKDWFLFQSSSLFEMPQSEDKAFTITKEITASKCIQLQNSKYSWNVNLGLQGNASLFRFAAHIISPSRPKFHLTIQGISKDVMTWINQALDLALWKAGFIDSLGMMQSKFSKKENFGHFCEVVITSIKKEIPNAHEAELHQKLLDKSIINQIKENYTHLTNRLKLLKGFFPLPGLALFHECLIDHPHGLGSELLAQVRLATVNCFQIAAKAENIFNKNSSHNEKHTKLFELAGSVLTYMVSNKQSMIIHTGNPIKPDDLSTHHTFYVVLKYIIATHRVQVIIVNAGSGCAKRSKPYQYQAEFDTNQYHYAAFKPVSLDTHQETLKHYFYVLFRMRYFKADQDKTGDYSFENLLQDAYLRPPDQNSSQPYFIGYQFKNIIGFERADLDESFIEQLTGNCVIYNFKLAIKIAFNLNEMIFGQLVDTLMLGLDGLITHVRQHLTPSQQSILSNQMPQEIKENSEDDASELQDAPWLKAYQSISPTRVSTSIFHFQTESASSAIESAQIPTSRPFN